jgi:hypothetical protein
MILCLIRCVANQSKYHSSWDQSLEMWEVIAQLIVSQTIWLLVSHCINDGESREDEEDFHDGIVDRDKVPKDVHVSEKEHGQVHFLRLARQTNAVP